MRRKSCSVGWISNSLSRPSLESTGFVFQINCSSTHRNRS
jgi:hypothetical protein